MSIEPGDLSLREHAVDDVFAKFHLRRTLTSLKKQDITSYLGHVDKLARVVQNSRKLKKEQLIEAVIKKLNRSNYDLFRFAASLEIIYMQTAKKNWQVFSLDSFAEFVSIPKNGGHFESMLLPHLKIFFNFAAVKAKLHREVIWCRIGVGVLHAPTLGKPMISAHFCFYPGLPYILARLPAIKDVRKNILNAVAVALNGLLELDPKLTGQDPISLFQLLIQKTLNRNLEKNRFLPEAIQDRLIETVGKPDKFNDDTVNLDLSEIKEWSTYREKHFGSYVQPALQRLTFRAETKFHGFDESEENDIDYFHTTMTLKGSNVLQGICELIDEGNGSILPPFMENLSISANNYFNLIESDNLEDDLSGNF